MVCFNSINSNTVLLSTSRTFSGLKMETDDDTKKASMNSQVKCKKTMWAGGSLRYNLFSLEFSLDHSCKLKPCENTSLRICTKFKLLSFTLLLIFLLVVSHPRYFYRNTLHLESLPVLLNYTFPETMGKLCYLVGEKEIV